MAQDRKATNDAVLVIDEGVDVKGMKAFKRPVRFFHVSMTSGKQFISIQIHI